MAYGEPDFPALSEEEEAFLKSLMDDPVDPEPDPSIPVVLLMGLDESGKTSLLGSLCYGTIVTSIPTELKEHTLYCHDGVQLVFRELGGRFRFRDDWYANLTNARALLWVIDAIDRGRVLESRDESWRLLDRPEMGGLPILIALNKQDAKFRMPTADILDRMQVAQNRYSDRKILVVECSKKSCPDLVDGMSWLVQQMGLAPEVDKQ
jgi:GTPase SAR1 family protein